MAITNTPASVGKKEKGFHRQNGGEEKIERGEKYTGGFSWGQETHETLKEMR